MRNSPRKSLANSSTKRAVTTPSSPRSAIGSP
jgi:hypothetical protein